MHKSLLVLSGVVFGACALAAPAAEAHTDAEAGWRLTARARTMCEISTTGGSGAQAHSFEIGVVRELCNAGQGYQVEVRFSNLVGGRLEVDGERYDISVDGLALVTSNTPRLRTAAWRVVDPEYGSGSGTGVSMLISPGV